MIYVILSNDVFIMNIYCQYKKMFIINLDCQYLSQPGAHLFRSGPGVRVRPLLWLCVGSHILWEKGCLLGWYIYSLKYIHILNTVVRDSIMIYI